MDTRVDHALAPHPSLQWQNPGCSKKHLAFKVKRERSSLEEANEPDRRTDQQSRSSQEAIGDESQGREGKNAGREAWVWDGTWPGDPGARVHEMPVADVRGWRPPGDPCAALCSSPSNRRVTWWGTGQNEQRPCSSPLERAPCAGWKTWVVQQCRRRPCGILGRAVAAVGWQPPVAARSLSYGAGRAPPVPLGFRRGARRPWLGSRARAFPTASRHAGRAPFHGALPHLGSHAVAFAVEEGFVLRAGGAGTRPGEHVWCCLILPRFRRKVSPWQDQR